MVNGLPVRSSGNTALLGVAAGLAERWGVSPTLVRLAFVGLSPAFGVGLLAYVALAFAMPWPEEVPRSSKRVFALAALPIVVMSVASTGGALSEGSEGFSLYLLWFMAAGLWMLVWLVTAVFFLSSRLDIFMGLVSAIGLGMVALVVTGIADVVTAVSR